jgi:hypothetical protein
MLWFGPAQLNEDLFRITMILPVEKTISSLLSFQTHQTCFFAVKLGAAGIPPRLKLMLLNADQPTMAL